MGYSDPQFQAKQEHIFNFVTGIASTAMIKWSNFQKRKLLSLRAFVGTAGTNASAGVDVYIGTTSVGALTIGTNTAGSVVTATFTGVTAQDGDLIEIRGKANSATMVDSYTLVSQLVHDGTNAN